MYLVNQTPVSAPSHVKANANGLIIIFLSFSSMGNSLSSILVSISAENTVLKIEQQNDKGLVQRHSPRDNVNMDVTIVRVLLLILIAHSSQPTSYIT